MLLLFITGEKRIISGPFHGTFRFDFVFHENLVGRVIGFTDILHGEERDSFAFIQKFDFIP